MRDLRKSSVTVTGGAGFLGSLVVDRLREQGCKNIFVPRSRDYDLRNLGDIQRLLSASRPDVIIHWRPASGALAPTALTRLSSSTTT